MDRDRGYGTLKGLTGSGLGVGLRFGPTDEWGGMVLWLCEAKRR